VSDAPVPEVGPELLWFERVQTAFLLRVVGPLRRRRQHAELPPPLSMEETARRLYALPVRYWTYDFEPGVRHLGPMSQDFAAAFGLDRTNRRIHPGDANGVALVAIQDLHRRLEVVERESAELRALLAERPHLPRRT
jgi:hypothetical protein